MPQPNIIHLFVILMSHYIIQDYQHIYPPFLAKNSRPAFYINEIHLESGHKNWSNSNKGPVKFYLKKGAWSITPVINSMSLPILCVRKCFNVYIHIHKMYTIKQKQ